MTGFSSAQPGGRALGADAIELGSGLGRGAAIAELRDVGARHESLVAGAGQDDHPNARDPPAGS